MTRQSTTRRGALTLTGGALVALAGCGGSGGTEEETPTATEAETEMESTEMESTETEAATDSDSEALLRVAHLSPDAPNVDVAVDGDTVLEDVPFGTVSDYLTLSPDEYQITVTPTGGDEAVFDEPVTLQSGLQTAAAIGEVAGEAQPFSLTLLTDDDTAPDSGSANVRVGHTVPDAPAVDVTAGEAVVADDVAFGEVSEYATVPADTAAVELRPESDENDADPVGTFELELTDAAAQTVFAIGYLEPGDDQPGVEFVAAVDAEMATDEGMTEEPTTEDGMTEEPTTEDGMTEEPTTETA